MNPYSLNLGERLYFLSYLSILTFKGLLKIHLIVLIVEIDILLEIPWVVSSLMSYRLLKTCVKVLIIKFMNIIKVLKVIGLCEIIIKEKSHMFAISTLMRHISLSWCVCLPFSRANNSRGLIQALSLRGFIQVPLTRLSTCLLYKMSKIYGQTVKFSIKFSVVGLF